MSTSTNVVTSFLSFLGTRLMGLMLMAAIISHSSSCNHCVCALSTTVSTPKYRIAIIGGGSSGMFAAASILDTIQNHDDAVSLADCIDVKIYESTGEVLRNIRALTHHDAASGGGGGILYDTSKKPRDLLNMGYPRGRKEITSLLTKTFPPTKQQTWFEDRGVEFTTQLDGSMVIRSGEDGASDDDDIINAILQDGVQNLIQTNSKISHIEKDIEDEGFQLTIQQQNSIESDQKKIEQQQQQHYDCVILATGNSHLGHQLAKSLGHTIAAPARSCFAFQLSKDDPLLSNFHYGSNDSFYLPYIRLSYKVQVQGQKRPRVFKSEGPAQLSMICNNKNDEDTTTFILGGNAALSLSSMACYELRGANYKGTLLVHFCPDHLGGKVEKLEEYLWQYRQDNPNEVAGERCPLLHHQVDYDEYDWETESFKTITNECIPPELWESLTEACGIAPGSPWSKASPKKVRTLSEMIVGCPLEFSGRRSSSIGSASKNPAYYNYINAGGILLNEIDMNTMKSKINNNNNNLYCCGQILDGDASLMSFSLMRDFATGMVAGENAVLHAIGSLDGVLDRHNS